MALERCSTGVLGFDDILAGGLPRNRFHLVQGDPGVGKTTLALQFLLEGKRLGEKGLYVTLSETKEELFEVAESHGWALEGIELIELSSLKKQMAIDGENTVFHPSDVELRHTIDAILAEIDKKKPRRVVFDSLSEIRLMAQSPLRYRRQLLALKEHFAGSECTVMLLDNVTPADENHIQTLAHGVIALEVMPQSYGPERRRLIVTKMRGVKYRGGYHDYLIRKGGLETFPRLVSAEHHKAFERREISSGIPAFDDLLDGGITRGTSTLILGPAGTGKSTFAGQFAASAAKNGVKSLLYLFDEGVNTFVNRCDSLGMGMSALVKAGTVRISKIDPSELSPSQLANGIRTAVEKDKEIGLVIIDSMNGYMNAMASEKHLPLQLHELLSYLNQTGLATLLTLAQHGLVSRDMQSPADITYLADTVVILRYFEALGAVRRAVSVMKKRSGAHEKTIREYAMDGDGLRLGGALTEFQGILTGIPTFVGSTEKLNKK